MQPTNKTSGTPTMDKAFIRTSFLVQHILNKLHFIPDEIEQSAEDSIRISYFHSINRISLFITVDSNLGCYVAVVNKMTDESLLGKEFKEYKCLDEAFELFKIPPATSKPTERIPDELHDNN